MAVINNSKKFVFVHIPKAAGTSVTKLLSRYSTYKDLEIGGTSFGESLQTPYRKRFGIYKHATAGKLKEIMGAEDWDEYFTFTFVRNPYERAVSIYNFLRSWEECPQETKKIMLSFSSFEEFICSDYIKNNKGPDEIFRNQAFWVTNPENRSEVIVDKVFKIENFDSFVKEVSDGGYIDGWVEDAIVPSLNKSRKEVIFDDLSSMEISMIENIYARDFHVFGYEKLSRS